MRLIGTSAYGIRLPIISQGEPLDKIVVDSVLSAVNDNSLILREKDVIGITESIVAKAEGNYATIDDIAEDIQSHFSADAKSVGLVFPILSRNRFLSILKGIAKGVEKLYVLLRYPYDEVGNPIMDVTQDDMDSLHGLFSEAEFRKRVQLFEHPFTKMDYINLYKSAGDNIELYFSDNAKDILKLTPNVIDAQIHLRAQSKANLVKAGARTVCLLSDILSKPKDGRGHNEQYGVLGSNLSSDNTLKLFPRTGKLLVNKIQKEILNQTGVKVEVFVYGDGAFKDPYAGIWELADPVVSPAYTEGLNGTPSEIKLKYIAENKFAHLNADEKKKAITQLIEQNAGQDTQLAEGTTPRRYTDLLGSLCDLVSGSGDKGTPVVLIQGYFDNYATD